VLPCVLTDDKVSQCAFLELNLSYMCCNVLQCVVVCCSMFHCTAKFYQYIAVCRRVFKCVAVCVPSAQTHKHCVAVCCSTMQYVAVS